jgi:hypothetical protein
MRMQALQSVLIAVPAVQGPDRYSEHRGCGSPVDFVLERLSVLRCHGRKFGVAYRERSDAGIKQAGHGAPTSRQRICPCLGIEIRGSGPAMATAKKVNWNA